MDALVIPSEHQPSLTMAQIAVPSIAANELLVQIKAIGVGVHDAYFLPPEMNYPYAIGIEAAGIVHELGEEVRGYAVGDRIAFISQMQPKGGVWAEYAPLSSDSLILPIPEQMSFEMAAAVPVAGGSTLRALEALPAIDEGGSIFVAGASGAIGTFALQLARARGWHVAASASPHNHDYICELGAELTVDYRDPQWPEQVRQWRPDGVDGALAVQPQTTNDSAQVVKRGGTVVTVSGDVAEPPGVTVTGLAYHVDVRPALMAFMDDVVAGKMRLVIEKVYPFSEALTALAKVQSRHARGKTILSVG